MILVKFRPLPIAALLLIGYLLMKTERIKFIYIPSFSQSDRTFLIDHGITLDG